MARTTRTAPETTTAVGYIRVSTDKQADHGISLDAQVADNIDTRIAAGRLALNVLGSVAQWERETIGERTTEALAHKKTRGHKTGGDVPYGFTLAADGKTEEDTACHDNRPADQ